MSLPSAHITIPGVHTVIGVFSGKGGVGKSFFAANFAAVLAKLGQRVGLFDGDISSPQIFSILGIKSKLSLTKDNKVLPIDKFGLKAVSMAGMCESEDEPVAWRGPIMSKILQKLLKDSIWGELDVLVIDFPTGASDIALTLLQHFSISGMILVTTPQEASITASRRAVNIALMLKVPLIGIVENMRGEVFGEGGGNKLSAFTGIPMLGSIPLRKNIFMQSDKGVLSVFHSEELELIFGKIARATMERVMVQ